MRSPLQTRLPPVTQCHRSSHLVSDGDVPVTSTRDGVKHDKMKSLTILNVEEQSSGSVQLPLNPVRRPLSPELARKEATHHKTNKHVIRRRFTPQMVAYLAGTTVFELEKMVRLEVSEDMRDMNEVECIGQLMPALEHLVLDDGRLSSLCYLGTNLTRLKSLSAARVGIRDLDGIGTLSGRLVELRLPGNRISDVTPLACNETINMLDLSSNLITNISAIDLLGSCSNLMALNLDGNPLTEIMKSVLPVGIARRVVCSSLPLLKRLDEIDVTLEDFFTEEYGVQETISWAKEVISIEVDKISIEGVASGSFPVSSLASLSRYNDNDEFTAKGGHTSLNGSPIAALRRQKRLEIKAELYKEGTLQHPPVSSLVNHKVKCDLTQGCITLTGTPSVSLRRKKHVEKKTKGEELCHIEGTTESEYIGTRNTITGLSYDSELTRGHETLTGAPTAALRRRKRLDEEIVSKTSDIQDGSSKLGLLEILDLAKAMDAETEKKDSETTDPMLEQLMCQWRKDVEEFDAQVLPIPSAEIHPGQSSKQQHIVISSKECPISPTSHLSRRSKHLSIVEIEDDEDLETPESVLPLPALEEFSSRSRHRQRHREIGRPSNTCESHISAQRRVRRSVLQKLRSSKPGGTLHRVDSSSSSSDMTSDVSSQGECESSLSEGESISRTFSREALKCSEDEKSTKTKKTVLSQTLPVLSCDLTSSSGCCRAYEGEYYM